MAFYAALPVVSPNLIKFTSNRRNTSRKQVRLPAWVIAYRESLHKHVAMVRDMTKDGMFLYCGIAKAASCGDEIEFVIRFPKWTNTPAVACKGKIVRIEQ